ncbi:MAG: hypothetical protein K2W85_01440 [Phycisphaerales bacterium]|nr:hypothetical protein [Phycisphaerales bacterium]
MALLSSLAWRFAKDTSPSSRVLAAAATVALLAGAATAQPAITNIGVLPGGDLSSGVGVSGDGTTVVGLDFPTVGSIRAYRWSRSTGTQQLVGLGGDTLAIAVSSNGSFVVGTSTPTNIQSNRAVRWTSPTTVQSLGTVGTDNYSEARGVNSDGSVIVGTSSTVGTPNSSRAFRWTSDGRGAGTMSSLGVLPSGTISIANGVSGDGNVVAGWGYVNNVERAFRWTQATGMHDLGVVAGFDSANAQGVSANGSTIVGYSGDLYGSIGSRGFRWTLGGGMQSLGVLTGGEFSAAFAANADGTMIVGTSTSTVGDRATLWTPTLGLVDLNNYLPSLGADLSGWSLSTAYGISLDGSVITGVGQFNGQTRAFVVTDVPAPGASVVLAMGGRSQHAAAGRLSAADRSPTSCPRSSRSSRSF